MLARQLEALTANVDHDGDGTTANVDFLADRYEFQLYYLTERTERMFMPTDHYLDLIRLRSGVYADYFQLSGLDATFRAAVGKKLYDDGVRFAWDPGKAVGSAFYAIGSNGVIASSASPTPSIAPVETGSVLKEMEGGRISGVMTYSVGMDLDTPLTTNDPISVFAQKNSKFPSGFEILVVGPNGARKVYGRLMLMAEYRNRVVSRVNTVTVTTSEF